MLLRKLIIIFLLLLLVVNPATVARADLTTDMQNMFRKWGFRVTGTEAGAYDAQSRGFIVGGSVVARSQSEYLQPFTLKPPSIKAGCGGIDIFGGAFSFINAEQLTMFAKKIGQNAIGYAFSLGLEAVCPTCNSVIKDMRKIMNDINKMGMDSCYAAKGLVNLAGEAAGLWDLEKCKLDKASALGQQIDKVAGYFECAVGSESEIRAKLRENALLNNEKRKNNKEQVSSVPGATTHQALQWTSLTPKQRQMVMSLIGTWYTTAGPDETTKCAYQGPTLGLGDLVKGGKVKLLACGDGGLGDMDKCESITMVEENIDGFAKLVKDTMAEIIRKYKTNTPLTDREKEFVNSIPVPPVAYMIQSALAYSENLATNLVDITSEAAAAMLAWHMVENALKAFESGTHRIASCGLAHQSIMDQVRKVREERQELFNKYMAVFNTQAKFLDFMVKIDANVAMMASKKLHNILAFSDSVKK